MQIEQYIPGPLEIFAGFTVYLILWRARQGVSNFLKQRKLNAHMSAGNIAVFNCMPQLMGTIEMGERLEPSHSIQSPHGFIDPTEMPTEMPGKITHTAVHLIGNCDYPVLSESGEFSEVFKGILLQTRKDLIDHFELDKLRQIVVINASSEDLIGCIANPSVDHVIVHGHGRWSSWQDSGGASIDEHYLRSSFLEKCFPHKTSFIRLTCGRPKDTDVYEDQLGYGFAENTFGRAYRSNNKEVLTDPLHHTSKEEFEYYKTLSLSDFDWPNSFLGMRFRQSLLGKLVLKW